MNRLIVHIIFASLCFTCSQQSGADYHIEEASPGQQVEAEEIEQNVEGLNENVSVKDEETSKWDADESISSVEKDKIEDLENSAIGQNQKNNDKFVKLFAKQKMDEFIELWIMYFDENTQAEMKEIIYEEFSKLIEFEAREELLINSVGDEVKLKKLNLLEVLPDEEGYIAIFSFKLNGSKFQSEALVNSKTTDQGEVWSFKISSVQYQ